MEMKGIKKSMGSAYFQILIILFLLFLYILTKLPLFGLAAALFLIAMVILEFYEGIMKNGWKSELVETGKTIAIAIVLWIALTFVLSTSSPISAVVSCSMVPDLSRGDMIIVKGENSYASNAINATEADALALFSNPTVYFGNRSMKVDGSIYNYCYSSGDREICSMFFKNPELFVEKRGSFTFTYSQCIREDAATSSIVDTEPCITDVSYNSKSIDVQHDRTSNVIIYNPNPSDLFGKYGDIVHRNVIQVKTESNTYYLTKGDNNNVFDIQFYSEQYSMGNTPFLKDQIKGKVISKIPYLGYYKLFISFYLNEDKICGTKLIK
ncbi:MAG: hypothetical protein NTY68_01915 [Candidatus Micrarchaeota archaeon]|nr:hypothetical protein [Candidatus Micrarchaeota archaeon]